MQSDSPIKTSERKHILEVKLDRPKANAIDLKTSRILGEIFTKFRDDPNLRVAIITGEGEKFFCPGWDLKAAAEGDAVDAELGAPAHQVRQLSHVDGLIAKGQA